MSNWLICTSRDRRDAKRSRPGDDDYDPKTLHLPPEFVKGLSGGQVIGIVCFLFWPYMMYLLKQLNVILLYLETMVGVQVKAYGQGPIFQGLSFICTVFHFVPSGHLPLPLCSYLNYASNVSQMGKFYELFEMDAHIGAKELDLQYMKVTLIFL